MPRLLHFFGCDKPVFNEVGEKLLSGTALFGLYALDLFGKVVGQIDHKAVGLGSDGFGLWEPGLSAAEAFNKHTLNRGEKTQTVFIGLVGKAHGGLGKLGADFANGGDHGFCIKAIIKAKLSVIHSGLLLASDGAERENGFRPAIFTRSGFYGAGFFIGNLGKLIGCFHCGFARGTQAQGFEYHWGNLLSGITLPTYSSSGVSRESARRTAL